MSEASRTHPEIYPRYCFHLSPTINTWCLLRACDLGRLEQYDGFQGENFFFYKNLPIKWVRIVGVVVAIDDFISKRVYTIDDSSGACAEVVVAMQSLGPATKHGQSEQVVPRLYQDIVVGAVVDVKGSLQIFRDEKQIKVEKMARLRCTEQELALWKRRTDFRRQVLQKPWVLQRRDIRRCRKEAEGPENDARRKDTKHKPTKHNDPKRKERRAKPTKNGVGLCGQADKHDADGGQSRDTGGGVTRHLIEDMIRSGLTQGKYNALGL